MEGNEVRSPALRSWSKSPESRRSSSRRRSSSSRKSSEEVAVQRRRSLGPVSPNLAHSARRKVKREKSVPPASMQLSLLKCQAAQAQMIIAHQRRKYQDAMDALVLAEEGPRSRTEELAAEIAELQRRKEAALKGDRSSIGTSQDDDDLSDHSDDDDHEDEIDLLDFTARRTSITTTAIPVPEAIPIAIPEACGNTTLLNTDEERHTSDQTQHKQKNIPIAQRQPWEITIAEPIVFQALMHHQDRVFAKFYNMDSGQRKQITTHQDAYDAPPALQRPNLPRQDKPIGGDDQDSTFHAIHSGLKTLAPYLFNFYGGQPSATPTTKKKLPQQRPALDPYADIAPPTPEQVAASDSLIWDPHRIDTLETRLTSPNS